MRIVVMQWKFRSVLILFRLGIFGAGHWWLDWGRGGRAKGLSLLPRICHAYPTMMKYVVIPHLKKYIYRLRFDTHFLILLTFLESLKIFLINLIIILMMPAKMASPGFLKLTVFWDKDYDVIIPVNDITKKILLCDSNYIVNY